MVCAVSRRSQSRNDVHSAPSDIPQHLQAGHAQCKLIENLRPILELPGPAKLVEVFGHHDRIARHHLLSVERAEHRPALPFAYNRTIGFDEVHAALVGILGGTAGLGEIVTHPFAALVDVSVLVVDRPEDADSGRIGRYIEPVTVFQHKVRQVFQGRALSRHFENDAAVGANCAHPAQQPLLRFSFRLQRFDILGIDDAARALQAGTLCFFLQARERFIEAALLIDSGRLPREFRSIQVGMLCQATDPHDEFAQRFAESCLVDASGRELAFQPHILGLLRLRNTYVVLGEDSDDVSRLQGKIVLRIATDDRLVQVEGNQTGGQRVEVEPLDDCVVPINLRRATDHFVPEGSGSEGLVRSRSAIANPGFAYAHIVLADPVIGYNKRILLGNDVLDPQAALPGKAHDVCDIAAQRDCVVDLRRQCIDVDQVAVLERLRIAGHVELEFLHLARQAGGNPFKRDLLPCRGGG